jgi:hypothetical protein
LQLNCSLLGSGDGEDVTGLGLGWTPLIKSRRRIKEHEKLPLLDRRTREVV